ncbi:hypothetical protein ACVXZ0_13305 [Staphylococcus aureus]
MKHTLGAVHGLKYWYNYTSDDLINFKPEGPILKSGCSISQPWCL